jgi:hypothetical protein
MDYLTDLSSPGFCGGCLSGCDGSWLRLFLAIRIGATPPGGIVFGWNSHTDAPMRLDGARISGGLNGVDASPRTLIKI